MPSKRIRTVTWLAGAVAAGFIAAQPTGRALPGGMSSGALRRPMAPPSPTNNEPVYSTGLGSLQRTATPDPGWRLDYQWADYFGATQRLALAVSSNALAEADDAFGISHSSRIRFFADNLKLTDARILPVADAMREKRGPVHFPAHKIAATADYQAFDNYVEEVESGYLRRQGLRMRNGHQLQVDYAGVLDRHRPLCAGISDEFVQLGVTAAMSWNHLLHTLMSFVQQLPYDVPPQLEGAHIIQGVWPPIRTVYLGRGDCDTKAILFGAIANNFPKIRAAIVVIPGHAFSGLIGWHKRLPRDMVVQHRGQDVLLVDLTGQYNYPACGMLIEEDRQNLRQRKPEIHESPRAEDS